jgi:hypothetical protein
LEHIEVFSMRELARRPHAPDIQQLATPAQFELRQVKERFRFHARTIALSD